MKLRTGFVSNSSSSSFIISNNLVYNNVYNTYDELDAEDILNAVKYEIRKYRDNKIKYAKRYLKHYLKHYKDEPTEGDINDYRKGIMTRYSDKNIDEEIQVLTLDKAQDVIRDLDYWYSKRVLQHGKYIILDKSDNFIPEKIAQKIIKCFGIPYDEYQTHMG